jgi:hypothetical protein
MLLSIDAQLSHLIAKILNHPVTGGNSTHPNPATLQIAVLHYTTPQTYVSWATPFKAELPYHMFMQCGAALQFWL